MSALLRVLIVDDERAAQDRIRRLMEAHTSDVVVDTCDNGTRAVAVIRDAPPDLVFLDVQMPGMDGLQVIGAVGVELMPVTIFVTAHEAFTLRAFEHNAVDYLLKPFTDERLLGALERGRRRVAERRVGELSGLLQWFSAERGVPPAANSAVGPSARLDRILVRISGRTLVIAAASIDWIEASGPYAELRVGDARHLVRMSMRELEQRLDRGRFLRIHRSTIVNLDRVVSLEELVRGEFVVLLRGGTRLKLSRGRRLAFEQALGQRL